MIPVLRPSCSDAEIAAVTEVLRSGWWGMGPKCAEFEERLAQRAMRRHCVTTNSATSALTLALRVLGVGAGDEVILPALTFISTALAVVRCGARPVFADVDAESLCLDYASALSLVRPGYTRAMIAVDYAGYPSLTDPSTKKLARWGGPIVQDAAHSVGGPAWGDLVCYSFHPVKNLATGDGGAILCDRDDWTERLRRLRWCGIDKSTSERTAERYSWDYSIDELGEKAHWNDIQAAIGLVQLQRLDAMHIRRLDLASTYFTELRDYVQLPHDHPEHTWHLYVVRVDADQRQPLIDALGAAGIAAGVHYRPLTMHRAFLQPTPPVTEREWQRCVSLPIFADMTDEEQDRVIDVVRNGRWRRAA